MASSATIVAPQAYYIPPLTASNYVMWSNQIEMLLIWLELWFVVDGTKVAPVSSNVVGLIAWKLKDSKARSYILLHLAKRHSLLYNYLKLQNLYGIVSNRFTENPIRLVKSISIRDCAT